MTKVRDTVNDGKKNSKESIVSIWTQKVFNTLSVSLNQGLSTSRMVSRPLFVISSFDDSSYQLYMGARYVGWFIVSAGMITALPLILEVCS